MSDQLDFAGRRNTSSEYKYSQQKWHQETVTFPVVQVQPSKLTSGRNYNHSIH